MVADHQIKVGVQLKKHETSFICLSVTSGRWCLRRVQDWRRNDWCCSPQGSHGLQLNPPNQHLIGFYGGREKCQKSLLPLVEREKARADAIHISWLRRRGTLAHGCPVPSFTRVRIVDAEPFILKQEQFSASCSSFWIQNI